MNIFLIVFIFFSLSSLAMYFSAQATRTMSNVGRGWEDELAGAALITWYFIRPTEKLFYVVAAGVIVWAIARLVTQAPATSGVGLYKSFTTYKPRWFWTHPFVAEWVPQILVRSTIALPILVVAFNRHPIIWLLVYAGCAVWAAGIACLFAGYANKIDAQYYSCVADILTWWGLWLIVSGTTFGFMAVLSPVILTWWIMRTYGLPLFFKGL